MRGYCPDCGNTLCLCDEVTKATYPLRCENAELKALVRELVKACEWAANIDSPCYKTKCTCVEDGCQIVLSKNKELIEAIKG